MSFSAQQEEAETYLPAEAMTPSGEPQAPRNIDLSGLIANTPRASSLRLPTNRYTVRPPRVEVSGSGACDTRTYDSAFLALSRSLEEVRSRAEIPSFLLRLEQKVRPRCLDPVTADRLLLDVLLDKAPMFLSVNECDSYPAARARLLLKTHAAPSQRLQQEFDRLLEGLNETPDDRIPALAKFRYLVHVHHYVCAVLEQTPMPIEMICDLAIEMLPPSRRQVVRNDMKRGHLNTLEDAFDAIEQNLEEWKADHSGTSSSGGRVVSVVAETPLLAIQQAERPLRCAFCGKHGTYARVCSCPQAVRSRDQTEARVTALNPDTAPLQPPIGSVRTCYNCHQPGHVRAHCPNANSRPSGPYSGSNRIPLPARNNMRQQQDRTSSSSVDPSVRCIYCGANHISRLCTQNPLKRVVTVCNYCGYKGHHESVCRIRSNDENSIRQVTMVAGNEKAVRETQSSI